MIKCDNCSKAATHYGVYDWECQSTDPEHCRPSCNDCALGDYEMCLDCRGHIDGNETPGCRACSCFDTPAADT